MYSPFYQLIYKNSLDNLKAKDQLYREVDIQYKLRLNQFNIINKYIVDLYNKKYCSVFSNQFLSIRHPHILRLYTYFEDDKRVFIVLEFAPKGELYAYLKKCGRFEDRQAAKVIFYNHFYVLLLSALIFIGQICVNILQTIVLYILFHFKMIILYYPPVGILT